MVKCRSDEVGTVQLESRGLQHRQVGGLRPVEDAIDIAGCASVLIDDVRSVGDQTACCDKVARWVDRGQLMPSCQSDRDEALLPGLT